MTNGLPVAVTVSWLVCMYSQIVSHVQHTCVKSDDEQALFASLQMYKGIKCNIEEISEKTDISLSPRE